MAFPELSEADLTSLLGPGPQVAHPGGVFVPATTATAPSHLLSHSVGGPTFMGGLGLPATSVASSLAGGLGDESAVSDFAASFELLLQSRSTTATASATAASELRDYVPCLAAKSLQAQAPLGMVSPSGTHGSCSDAGYDSTPDAASPGPCPLLCGETTFLKIHVNGYRSQVSVKAAYTTTVAELKRQIFEEQLSHPHAITQHEAPRLLYLNKQPTTMNTSCKFDEATVIQEIRPDGTALTLMDLQPIEDIYLYLLCPEPPLSTERRNHRRIAKRECGVCEAHRGQTARKNKKTRNAFSVPGLRARITQMDGQRVDMRQLRQLQDEWRAMVPGILGEYLEAQGLEVADVSWAGARQGSVILGFDLTFETLDGHEISEDERMEHLEKLQAFLDALLPKALTAANPRLEVTDFGFPMEEDANLICPTTMSPEDLAAVAVLFGPGAEEMQVKTGGVMMIPRKYRLDTAGMQDLWEGFERIRAFSAFFHSGLLRQKGAPQHLELRQADVEIYLHEAPGRLDMTQLASIDLCRSPQRVALSVGILARMGEDSVVISTHPIHLDVNGMPFSVLPFPWGGSKPFDATDPAFANCQEFVMDKRSTCCEIHNDLLRLQGLDGRGFEMAMEDISMHYSYTPIDFFGPDLEEQLSNVPLGLRPAPEAFSKDLLEQLETTDRLAFGIGVTNEAIIRSTDTALMS